MEHEKANPIAYTIDPQVKISGFRGRISEYIGGWQRITFRIILESITTHLKNTWIYTTKLKFLQIVAY